MRFRNLFGGGSSGSGGSSGGMTRDEAIAVAREMADNALVHFTTEEQIRDANLNFTVNYTDPSGNKKSITLSCPPGSTDATITG